MQVVFVEKKIFIRETPGFYDNKVLSSFEYRPVLLHCNYISKIFHCVIVDFAKKNYRKADNLINNTHAKISLTLFPGLFSVPLMRMTDLLSGLKFLN